MSRYCSVCGVVNKDTAKFCSECGSTMIRILPSDPARYADAGNEAAAAGRNAARVPSGNSEKGKKKQMLVIIAAAVLLLTAGIVIGFLGSGGKNAPEADSQRHLSDEASEEENDKTEEEDGGAEADDRNTEDDERDHADKAPVNEDNAPLTESVSPAGAEKSSETERLRFFISYETPGHAGVNLRSEPSSSSELLALLPEGTYVDKSSQTRDGYTYVTVLSSGLGGWVMTDYIDCGG